MFVKSDISRDACMLRGKFRRKGYDWWWHSFTAKHAKTGEEKQFFIEFFLCNPELGGEKPVLKKGEKPSYLMVKAGCWGEDARQLHRFFGWREVELMADAPYSVRAQDCFASEKRLCGSVHVTEEEAASRPEYMCQAGSMSWELKVDKKIAFNVGYGAGRLFRDIHAFEMYWHAEGMKTAYQGSVILDGERYEVRPEDCFGYADKNWGSDFTSPWVWLSSNRLVSNLTGKELKNSVFDIGGGRPKIFFLPLNRKLLGAFYYEGRQFEFNFSKFWTLTRTRFDCRETGEKIIWRVRQENRTQMMDVLVRCRKKDMLLVNYVAPDGSKRHDRLWNGGNGEGRIVLYRKRPGGLEVVDDICARSIGCEWGCF